ncbi:MAG: lipoyl(octanoyl) transferase LipB [Bacteroidetes bacterium]|nr:lipoyl(octanoyl) transferase LipB [Bacteroidota bacterium]MCB9044051.1 lipoyl(octanoyl) transferase LipB [Chitinophagales bacterium]
MWHKNKNIYVLDIGLIEYGEAWQLQEQILKKIVAIKVANRERSPENQQKTPNFLLLCAHPHVYTLGKSGKMAHLLLNQQALDDKNIAFFHTNRGGDITYHGPDQIVGYPILDLENFFTDVHKYLRFLEESIILTLQDYGLHGERSQGETGVWLEVNTPKARKICAMGIRCSRWVSMHGWAMNINTDLRYFQHIVPCGITDKAVASLHKELGVEYIDKKEVQDRLIHHFLHIFAAEAVPISLEKLNAFLTTSDTAITLS